MAIRWRGELLREGVETGDHRLIEAGATRWRELPRDLGCVFEDGWGGHENAIVVGTIESITRVGSAIMGEGAVLIGNEDADKWVNMNVQGAMHGCSVDLTGGECVIEVVNVDTGEVLDPEIGIEVLWGPDADSYYVRERWTDAEIGSTAVCRVPAFAEALIEVYDTETDAAPAAGDQPAAAPAAAAAAGTATFAAIEDVAVGDDVSWTDDAGVEQTGTITAVDTEAETVTVDVNVADGEDPMEVVLPVADVTVSSGDAGAEAASGFEALRQRTEAAASPRPALAALLARDRGDTVQASLAGSTFDRVGAVVQASVSWGDGPPADAFAQRDFDRPTPFTIDDDGRCYGHLRLNGQCHMGYMSGSFNRCVTVPDSPSAYALFHANRQIRCDDGSRVPVGVLAMDGGHAPEGRPGRRPSLAAVQRWYEDTAMQAAYLHAYDDQWGTQVCGILRDGLPVEDARRAMASSPSGDWRDYGQGLDLTGITMVNVPGYPQYEVEDGSVMVLLASLSPPPGVELRLAQADTGCDGSCGCGGTCGGGTPGLHEHASALATNRRAQLAGLDLVMASAHCGPRPV